MDELISKTILCRSTGFNAPSGLTRDFCFILGMFSLLNDFRSCHKSCHSLCPKFIGNHSCE